MIFSISFHSFPQLLCLPTFRYLSTRVPLKLVFCYNFLKSFSKAIFWDTKNIRASVSWRKLLFPRIYNFSYMLASLWCFQEYTFQECILSTWKSQYLKDSIRIKQLMEQNKTTIFWTILISKTFISFIHAQRDLWVCIFLYNW